MGSAPMNTSSYPSLEPTNPHRVLVVDDDPRMLRAITTLLRRSGYEVITAADVDQALIAAERHAFAAAVVDYTLHDETGLAVLWRLRRLQPSCARLLCTGRQDAATMVEAVNHGEINKVVNKPFRARELLRLLGEAVEASRERDRAKLLEDAEQNLAERKALDEVMQGEVSMAIQPIVHTGNLETPVYFEALVRPSHPVLTNPVALLSAAERQQMALEVSSKILRSALQIVRVIPEDTGLFVNIHPEQLSQPRTLLEQLSTVREYAPRVALEITERSRLRGITGWEESLALATDMGFQIAVDDLGAGYSSLSILADLQPQFIKIDMSLVRGIQDEPRKQRLVQLIKTFGEATDSVLIAEGVETAEEAAALRDCQIEYMQGYLFGRPTPPRMLRTIR